MKKVSMVTLIVSIVGFALFLFFFVFYPDGKNTVDLFYEYCFTFISPIANEGYWGSAAYGMKQEDAYQNSNTKFIGLTNSTEKEMTEVVTSALCADIDGIITVGNNDMEVITSLKKASDKNVPIVLIDTDSKEIDRICYVGTDNYEAGRLAGKDMTFSISEPLSAIVILSSKASNNQQERLRGFEEELSCHTDCHVEKVLETNSSLLLLNETLPRILKENPDINAIFCAEGYSSSIVGKILDFMGVAYKDIRVVAFDKMENTLDFVRSGRYYSTIVQQSDKMGEIAVRTLKEYIDGVSPKKDTIYTKAFSIKQDNFDSMQKYESGGVTWHSYNRNIMQIPQKKN